MARYRRFRRVYSRVKRNVEKHIRGGSSLVAQGTQQTAYTYEATQACTANRVKLDIGVTTVGAATNTVIAYALVIVREGYNANTITYPALTDDMYNPTMDVLISGVLTDGGVEDHKYSYGRRMKTGDRLCLIVYNASTAAIELGVSFEMSMNIVT